MGKGPKNRGGGETMTAVAPVRTKTKAELLCESAFKGNLADVNKFLNKGAWIDHPSVDNGFTSLMLAAQNGHDVVVETLLKKNANPNIELVNQGTTALLFATVSGHIHVVSLLLEAGANPNCERCKDFKTSPSTTSTPLTSAAEKGQLEISRLLLKHGGNPNIPITTDGSSPLLLACQKASGYAIAKLLLDNGANPSAARSLDGATPLIMSAKSGFHKTTQLLLERGAAADWRMANGMKTALAMGVEHGHYDAAKALLEADADPNSPDFSTGWTPLMSASRQGRMDIIGLLLDHGADPNCDVTPAMNHLTWQTTTRYLVPDKVLVTPWTTGPVWCWSCSNLGSEISSPPADAGTLAKPTQPAVKPSEMALRLPVELRPLANKVLQAAGFSGVDHKAALEHVAANRAFGVGEAAFPQPVPVGAATGNLSRRGRKALEN